MRTLSLNFLMLYRRALITAGSSGLAVEFFSGFRNKPDKEHFDFWFRAMGYGLPAAIGACVA